MITKTVPTLPSIPRDADGNAAIGSRLPGNVRSAFADFIFSFSDYRCVVCGQDVIVGAEPNDPKRAELGHLVPGGPKRLGYVPGNIACECRACNAAGHNIDQSKWIHLFAIPEGIPTEWPTNRELLAMASNRAESDHATRARAIRSQAGLPF